MHKVACIVLNYNSWEMTKVCVDNLLRINIKAEIVIVDNASPNDSFRKLQNLYKDYDNIYVLESGENKGYSYGNNIGARFAIEQLKSKYICIMNPDTIFEDNDMLERLADKLAKNDNLAVIAPIMIQHNKKDLDHCCWNIPSKRDFVKRQLVTYKPPKLILDSPNANGLIYVDVVHGSFFMIKSGVLEKIGYLDESIFMYYEETLLAIKLRRLGMKEALDVTEEFFHNHPKSKKQVPLLKKLSFAYKGGFKSKKYICKYYYPSWMLPLMYLLYGVNVLLIILVHMIGKVKRIVKSN